MYSEFKSQQWKRVSFTPNDVYLIPVFFSDVWNDNYKCTEQKFKIEYWKQSINLGHISICVWIFLNKINFL
jgi:hypothetical protein